MEDKKQSLLNTIISFLITVFSIVKKLFSRKEQKMDIRIYYESLEQAEYYIKPLITSAFANLEIDEYSITLIEKVQQNYTRQGTLSKKYAKKISEILIQKNPDVIISTIKDDVEIPLVILEFSTAVFTKDHELQRTDNFNVALLSNAIYIKVSPITKNSGAHGGDTSYEYLEPYSLFYKKFNELSFHINWDVDANNDAIVEKHPLHKSIPSETQKISELMKLILSTYLQNISNDNWKHGFNDIMAADSEFTSWVNSLANLTDYEDITTINTTRMSWSDRDDIIEKDNVFTLKLNRLGHAMDPERGMLNYYSTFFKNDTNTFIAKLLFNPSNQSWYKDTPKESEIRNMVSNGFNNNIELVKAMFLGLSLPNFDRLRIIIEGSNDTIINITDYVNENILSFNTPFRSIIKNSDILYITDGSHTNIYMTWDDNSYIEHSHDECPSVTSISEREKLSEDDVTFTTIHSFFSANNIQTLSVSYPGAQSDMPILPQPNSGRRQQRVYIDAIGTKNDYMIFQENKGPYSRTNLNKDIEKIIKFKNEPAYQTAIVEFKRKNSISTEKLFIGIGYGETNTSSNANTQLNLDDIDYQFVLSKDMSSWKVFSSINRDDDFEFKEGETNIITTYKVNNG